MTTGSEDSECNIQNARNLGYNTTTNMDTTIGHLIIIHRS